MQIVLSDLLFINYSVPPERLRPLVPDSFELDTKLNEHGEARAFVSIVAFKVDEVHSTSMSLPGLSFNQVNCRAYIAGDQGPAVYFLDLKVGSRMIASMASFIRLPVSYEEIELTVEKESATRGSHLRISVDVQGEAGLNAVVTRDDESSVEQHDDPVAEAEFITERPVGFIKSAAGAMYRIVVGHETLRAVQARCVTARAPILETLGILNADEALKPKSVLYVEEAIFDAESPARWPG